ncbi:MAG TPA: hypothetical protein VG013_16920 [Gemmataceae bacterium]|jgi:hypothetical protein|nr:hypothetical protein [Gemmataceae bacterium]
MTKTIRGKVHGKTIKLDEDLGVADGQEVEVQVKIIPPTKQWGDGLRRCAGALAHEWTDEDDRILEEIHQDRKRDTRKELAE